VLKKGCGVKVVFIVLWCLVSLYAQEHDTLKITKLAQKGARIASVMCEVAKLPKPEPTLEATADALKASAACRPLSASKRKAVAAYIMHGATHQHASHIDVPGSAKCPVCGMFVAKYPKWAAAMQMEGKTYYFDGVKDMMKYYIFDGDFPYDRNKIDTIWVSDYYTLEAVSAKEAYYVLDPNVFGPMGHELIPFKSAEAAETFMQEHHGKRIVRFHEITARMVMALDGIEL